MAKSDMFEDATRVWKMLDEMALNDPLGYKKFIDQQLKAGRKSLSPPEVRFVIKATLKETKRSLYVNFCEWAAIPESNAESTSIVIKCGETFVLDGDTGIALAFNPNTFVQHGFGDSTALTKDGEITAAKDRTDENNRCQLIWLGLHYLEMEKQLPTVESNSVICTAAPLRPKPLCPSEKYGSRKIILQSIGYHKRLARARKTHSPPTETDSVEQVLQNVLKDMVPEQVGKTLPGDVLDASTDESVFSSSREPLRLPQSVKAPRSRRSGPLIEELQSQAPVAETAMDKVTEGVQIQWRAEVLAVVNKEEVGISRPNQLKIIFELPGIKSGSQCDLDITADKLLLNVADGPIVFKPLEIVLPCKVDTLKAEAKFNSKRGRLVVLVPIISSH